jgi:uncharacterized membrane protein YfhO
MMFYEVEVLWYGLDAPDGLYRRMSFLFSFIIIRCGYECLSENDENKKLEWKKILVLLLSLAVDLYYNQVSFAFSIVSIVLYYIFRDKKKETCVIFTMELFLMTFYGFCENGYTEVPCANLTVEREEKQNTERTSAIFEENPNISLVTKEYNTFSVFVSGCNLNVCNLFFSLGHLGGNTNYMSNVTLPSSLYTLLGTDTIISDQEEYVPYFVPDEENSDEEQGRYVYQNTRNLPIGYIVPDNMLDYEGTSKNIFENNNELTQLVVGEDIYSDIPFELNDSKLSFTADKDYEEILVSSLFDTATSEAENFYGNVFVYVDGEKICTKKTNANTSGYTYTIYLHDIKKGDKVLVEYSEMYFETTTASVEEFHKDAFDKFYNVLSQEVLENTSYSNGIYAGQITCRKDSTLMITVPYDVCLKAYVDGEETEIMPVLKDALCGINITAGEHNIVLSYEDDILPYTMGISLIFITFNVLLLTFHKRFDKKKML